MKKPHEQEWTMVQLSPGTTPCVEGEGGGVIAVVQVPFTQDAKHFVPQPMVARDRATLLAAAPDMARALKGAVYEVVGSHLPILGPDANSDVIVARGLPVQMSAQTFAAMVAALRKAGVL